MGILRGVRRLARVIGEPFYDQQPVYAQEEVGSPVSAGDEWAIDPETGEPIPLAVLLSRLGTADEEGALVGPNSTLVMPRPRGQVVATQRTPSRLLRVLGQQVPRFIEAGVAAGATPNIAGGGPTDIFRAAQAGMQGYEAAPAREIGRRKAAQELEYGEARRQREIAEAEEARARAALERAQVQGKPALAKNEEEYWTHVLQDPNATPEERDAARGRLREINAKATPTPASTEEAMLVRILSDPGASAEAKARAQARLNAIKAPRPVAPPATEEAMLVRTIVDSNTPQTAKDQARARLRQLNDRQTNVDVRTRTGRLLSAEATKGAGLRAAEQNFARQKAALDKSARDPLTAAVKDPTAYQDALYDLETQLQTSKNLAQETFEHSLAALGVEYDPYRYPHPSNQRQAAPPAAAGPARPATGPAGLPPPPPVRAPAPPPKSGLEWGKKMNLW